MADQIKIQVLRAYRKRGADGSAVVVAVGEVLDEDKDLAINLITANKAVRAPADLPPAPKADEPAQKVGSKRSSGNA